MAGTPIGNAQRLYLTEHEQEVFAARANGDSWRKIWTAFKTSAHVLNLWIKENETRQAAWYALDQIAAEVKAADAETILEEAAASAQLGWSSPEMTRLAIARSEYAKWLAGVLNRGRYGPPAAASVNLQLNVGSMHLTATKAAALTPPPAPVALLADPAPVEADYEIVPDRAALEAELRAMNSAPVPPTLEELLGG